MDLKVIIFAFLGFHLFNFINCSKKRDALDEIPDNVKRNKLEFMNEGNHYSWILVKYPEDGYYYTPNRFYELPYRYPMRPDTPYRYPVWPIPYSYVLNNDKNQLGHSVPSNGYDMKHEHYLERFPVGLTYEVTEHINYGPESTTKLPLYGKTTTTTTTQKSLNNPKKNAAPIIQSTTAQQISNVQKKENQTEPEKAVKLLNNTVTLEAGPDVMNDSIRNGEARSFGKREIKSAVPVDILLDDSTVNTSKTDSNISQYLNKIFGDLDENSINDLLATLKNEYLTSATSAETQLIDDTFQKLAASLSNNNNNNNRKNKRSQDSSIKENLKFTNDDGKKAELLAKAAAALGLLAEEKSLVNKNQDDSLEDFLEDESYHDDTYTYDYDSISLAENIDEIKEPSFLELLNIATKHKASKVLKTDQ